MEGLIVSTITPASPVRATAYLDNVARMGVIRSTTTFDDDVGELRRVLLGGVAAELTGEGVGIVRKAARAQDSGERGGVVCVTGGLSFIGFAVVRRLRYCGYSVRLALESQEDLEKLREMEMLGETDQVQGAAADAVVATVMDVDSLRRAFEGCDGIFHTSAFTDPNGISGYTKHMVDLEVKAAERVIEACLRTSSIRRCVFTSSLLACIWRQNSYLNRRLIIDENSWSDETLCRDKKLWFALGKTMAEKAAWRAVRGSNLKLVTLCPALVTGPGFSVTNSTASIAYLKGAKEMYEERVLATADIRTVAEAHVCVYEGIDDTARGRFICFDHIISRCEEADALERHLGLPSRIWSESNDNLRPTSSELTNGKLSRLMSASGRCSYDSYSFMYSY